MTWNDELTSNLRSVQELAAFCDRLQVTAAQQKEIELVAQHASINIPRNPPPTFGWTGFGHFWDSFFPSRNLLSA
jgi:hypothetical protein